MIGSIGIRGRPIWSPIGQRIHMQIIVISRIYREIRAIMGLKIAHGSF